MIVSSQIIGLVGCLAGAAVTYQTFPDKVLKRKLGALLRTNDFHADLKQYNGKTQRIPPVVKSVNFYLDRKEATFMLPVGSDPNEVLKKQWVFQQVFGLAAELSMIDPRKFSMSIYTTSIQQFDYVPEEVNEVVAGMRLPIYVGKKRTGDVVYDLVDNPGLLIAGITGSGKSALVRSILTTLIRNVANMELYCADLKMTEFHLFKGIAKAVVYEKNEMLGLTTLIRTEMDRRSKLLEMEGVAHIDDLENPPPYIIFAIDEVARVSKEKPIMAALDDIGAIGRALGVFMILSMQRPDAELLKSSLKNNLSVRIALRHSDGTNSRITIDSGEAANIKQSEKGLMVFKMDGLFYVQGPNLTLDAAKELLAPYKTPWEKKTKPNIGAIDITPVEPDTETLELGVL